VIRSGNVESIAVKGISVVNDDFESLCLVCIGLQDDTAGMERIGAGRVSSMTQSREVNRVKNHRFVRIISADCGVVEVAERRG